MKKVSIYGVEVKDLKVQVGRNGITNSGIVYLDDKRLGRWEQDNQGGCDSFEFDISLLEPCAEKYQKTLDDSNMLKELMDGELLLSELSEWNVFYDEFLNHKNTGKSVYVVVTNGLLSESFATEDENSFFSKKYIEVLKNKIKRESGRDGEPSVLCFKSEKDFILQ